MILRLRIVEPQRQEAIDDRGDLGKVAPVDDVFEVRGVDLKSIGVLLLELDEVQHLVGRVPVEEHLKGKHH